MKPSSRNLALAWSVRNTRQTHSLSKTEMGWMQATTSIPRRGRERFFLDIPLIGLIDNVRASLSPTGPYPITCEDPGASSGPGTICGLESPRFAANNMVGSWKNSAKLWPESIFWDTCRRLISRDLGTAISWPRGYILVVSTWLRKKTKTLPNGKVMVVPKVVGPSKFRRNAKMTRSPPSP